MNTKQLLHFMLLALLLGLMMITANAGEPSLITFTNREGRAFTNAEVFKVDPSGIFFRYAGTSVGRIEFPDLPANIQKQLGYDPAKAADFLVEQKRKETAQKMAQQERAKNYAAQLAAQKRLREVALTRIGIRGKIIQKTAEGLLVNSGSEEWSRISAAERAMGASPGGGGAVIFACFDGVCLLTDFAGADKMVDGEVVETSAYPNGQYTYTTVQNASKTVRRFTANPAKVVSLASPEEMKAMRGKLHPR